MVATSDQPRIGASRALFEYTPFKRNELNDDEREQRTKRTKTEKKEDANGKEFGEKRILY